MADAWATIGLEASEIHAGAVGGHTAVVTVTPTLSTGGTYSANDYVGTNATPMTFAVGRKNGGTGALISAVLVDAAVQSVAAELWLFDTTVTTPADNAAWTITDAEALTCIGVIPFSTYYASATNGVAMGNVGAGIPFACSSGNANIFGALVTRGAPVYNTAGSGLSVRLGVLQD
jgi:hypothetical protein